MVKAVLFDIDGTLVDSNDLHAHAWQDAFRHFGKAPAYDAIRAQIGKGGDQLIPVFCTPEEIARFGEDLEAERGRIFRRRYRHGMRPFPRVRELFVRLRDGGVQRALASSSNADDVQFCIDLVGIADLLDATTSADDAARSKPCPDIFTATLQSLPNIEARDAVVVGDTPYDAIAARRAGLDTIAVLSGGFAGASLRAAGAIEVHRDIADLLVHFTTSRVGRRS